jgi:hypothetical protein
METHAANDSQRFVRNVVVNVAFIALLLFGTSSCSERHSSERERELAGSASSKARAKVVVSALLTTAERLSEPPVLLAAAVVQVRSVVEQRRARCQGVALAPTSVVTAKHCAGGVVDVRPWAGGAWRRAAASTTHGELDLAVLELSTPLPMEHFARLTEQCAVDRPLLAACYPGLGSATSELEVTRVKLRCSTATDCFSDTLELAPGASGCPLFDEGTGDLVALGVASLRDSSRAVCLTRAVLEQVRTPQLR